MTSLYSLLLVQDMHWEWTGFGGSKEVRVVLGWVEWGLMSSLERRGAVHVYGKKWSSVGYVRCGAGIHTFVVRAACSYRE